MWGARDIGYDSPLLLLLLLLLVGVPRGLAMLSGCERWRRRCPTKGVTRLVPGSRSSGGPQPALPPEDRRSSTHFTELGAFGCVTSVHVSIDGLDSFTAPLDTADRCSYSCRQSISGPCLGA